MLRFKAPDMSCGHCARAVAEAIRAVDPAARVEVDLPRREVAVDGATADAGALARALGEAGYPAERLPGG